MNSDRWQRSDVIAGIAAVMAGGSLYLQFSERDKPYAVQTFVDQTQASNAIISAVENVISARQVAMISVEWPVFKPASAAQMSLDQMNKDSRFGLPVIQALGNFGSALQNNVKFFSETKTLDALRALEAEVSRSVSCFTIIGSAQHRVSASQADEFRAQIVENCDGANLPESLASLKMAEAVAQAAMDEERLAKR